MLATSEADVLVTYDVPELTVIYEVLFETNFATAALLANVVFAPATAISKGIEVVWFDHTVWVPELLFAFNVTDVAGSQIIIECFVEFVALPPLFQLTCVLDIS